MKKKILLLSISRNGYTEEIVKDMEKRGLTVHYYNKSTKINKSELSKAERIYRTLYRDYNFRFLKNKIEKKEREIYKKYCVELDTDYDSVFDLGGVSNTVFLEELKKLNKGKFILFLWDDIKYHNEYLELSEKFDTVYSYNLDDAKKYDFRFRPSFYVNRFLVDNSVKKDIDLYYIGSMRDYERTLLVKKINEELNGKNLDTKICCSNYLKYVDRIGVYSNYKKYYRKTLAGLSEIIDKYRRSRCLLDIAYKEQKGLGLRPIETIATKSKLITTNQDIKNYDFYNENNIFVLEKDFSNINKLKEFIDKPYLEYTDEIRHKYSIDGFIDEVFGG